MKESFKGELYENGQRNNKGFGIESGGGKMKINWMTISGSFCPDALGAVTRKMSWTIPVFMAEEWWLELCSLLLRILWFFNAGASHVPFQWQHLHTLTNQTVNMRTYYDFDIGRSRSMIWYQSVRNVKINHFWRIWLETCELWALWGQKSFLWWNWERFCVYAHWLENHSLYT